MFPVACMPRRCRVAPIGPAYLLRDTFTDEDGTSLADHTMDVGGGWTVHVGPITTEGNKARAGDANYRTATADAGEANVDVRGVFDPGGAGPNNIANLLVRLSDATHFWEIQAYPLNGNVYIYEHNGSYVSRGSAAAGMDDGEHAVRAVANGTTITAYLDDVEIVSYGSATFNQSATRCGIDLTNGDTCDDFEVLAA